MGGTVYWARPARAEHGPARAEVDRAIGTA